MKYGLYGKGCPDKWVEAHGYHWIYDEQTDTLYWVTQIQCAEQANVSKRGQLRLTWHSRDFFYDLLKKIAK